MLYEAAHGADEGLGGPDDLRAVPDLARYVAGWGRPGDHGLVGALGDGPPAGAAWLRLMTGYAHVDDATPELAVGVAPAARGSGLGTALLARLLDDARRRHPAVSLSVRSDNPARRLYERLGFTVVAGRTVANRAGGTSETMVLRF
jgi:ribosomal protein S18 acetylase RimI-like enzyme